MLVCISMGDTECMMQTEVCDALCCFLLFLFASDLLCNSTQLNFTVAIDFTASNGKPLTDIFEIHDILLHVFSFLVLFVCVLINSIKCDPTLKNLQQT